MRRYLVVDDNAAFAENMADILRDAGAEATVAAGGEAALKFLAGEKFDALITDMRMPDLSGAELLREARRALPHLAAIVVSAWTHERDLREVEQMGLLAIFPKPVPIEALLSLLQRQP